MPDREKLFSYTEVADRVTAQGLPTTPRAVQGWAARYPDLKTKIGGRCAIRGDAVAMILAGVPLATVAEKMRDLKSAAWEAVLATGPSRRRSTSRGCTRARE